MSRGILLVLFAFALSAARGDSRSFDPPAQTCMVVPPDYDSDEDGFWVDGGVA